MKNLLSKIPNKPKIPLPNYLLDLVAESDGKESSLYLNDAEGIFEEIWSEIVRSRWRKLDVRKFAPEKLGVSISTIYYYKWGKKGIPIQRFYNLLSFWQRFCGKTNFEVTRKWDEVFNSNFTLSVSNKGAKTVLPKSITPKLSYLIGWICGDGHFYDQGNHYLVKISEKSVPQLELVLKPLFHELFSIDPPIFRRYMGSYAIQVGSKPIHRFFTRALGVRVGEIPSFIDSFDRTNKAFFLAGIFDAEGYVANGRYRLTISQANKAFLEKLRRLFTEFNLDWKNPTNAKTKLGSWYMIHLNKKTDLVNFSRSIGSYHIEKQDRLERQVSKIAKSWDR